MKKNFSEWMLKFKESINTYDFYVDFEKVYRNAEKFKVELNILNSLIGSKQIEYDFDLLVAKYPEILKCVPLLLAVRSRKILVTNINGVDAFDFYSRNHTNEEYKLFLRETGLFELLENKIVNTLTDYVLGIEVGLDSNGRKNRSGHLMENLVEVFLKETAVEYYKEMKLSRVMEMWDTDLKELNYNEKAEKRFDFVVKTRNTIYCIETNFYSGGGSKLNETARSYKNIALEMNKSNSVEFVWITDGVGWNSAKRNLKETFDVMENIFCIEELASGVLKQLFKDKKYEV